MEADPETVLVDALDSRSHRLSAVGADGAENDYGVLEWPAEVDTLQRVVQGELASLDSELGREYFNVVR